jgi:fibronectin type 3 domain-containing protein
LAPSSSIALTWTRNSSNETGFQVERSSGGSATFSLIATTAPAVNAFVDAGLAANTTYGYRVRAMGAGGASAYSNVATLKTPDNGIVGSYKLTGPGVTSGTDVGVPFSPYQQQGYTLTVTGGSFTVRSDFSYSLRVLMTVVSGGKSTNVTWDANGT